MSFSQKLLTRWGGILLASISIGMLQAQPVKPFVRTFPYDSASIPRPHNVDFKHLRLEASFDTQKGKVFGKVTHRFVPIQKVVDTIFLDAPGIDIKEVIHRGKSLAFTISPQGVTLRFSPSLTWDTEDSVNIRYEATPRKGLYFIGWNDPKGLSRKQIWTQGQGIDNRYWIPMYDEMNDKITSEMVIAMPKPYKVLSNGVNLGIRDLGNEQVWHYRMNKPHAPYLIMLGIGDYEIETRYSKRGLREDLWYYPDWKDRVETTYRYSTEMLDFFEQEIGVNYPWENYSQIPVQNFLYGAMENTTATIFGDFFHVDKRGDLDRTYVAVNAHELAHQWFGDLVTARSSTHHWLQESFATHYNMLYEREVFGKDHFDITRRRATISSLQASEKDLYNVAHSKAGSVRVYPKGACILEMLKYVVGREAYNRSVKHYLTKHGYGNVDTEDLLIAFHETLGESLDWFWDEWLYKGGEPSYEVKTMEVSGNIEFIVTQLQESGPYTDYFKMPIVFEVHYTDGTSSKRREWVEGKETRITVPHDASKKIAYTLFDPNSEVMKAVRFSKPFEQLVIQAEKATFMLDRLDAVEAMEAESFEKKRKVLQSIYQTEKSIYVRAAILKQLAKDKDKKSKSMIRAAFADPDVQIRKSVLAQFDTIPGDMIASAEQLLKDPSYDLLNSALNKLAFSNPSKLSRYLEMTSGEKGNISHNIRISWLKHAIKLGKKDHQAELIEYTSDSYEFLTRSNAFLVLRELKIITREAVLYSLDAAYNPNSKLSGNAIAFLNWIYREQPDWKPMLDQFAGSSPLTDWQKVIWERIRKA
jgi:aminopeptidase N